MGPLDVPCPPQLAHTIYNSLRVVKKFCVNLEAEANSVGGSSNWKIVEIKNHFESLLDSLKKLSPQNCCVLLLGVFTIPEPKYSKFTEL